MRRRPIEELTGSAKIAAMGEVNLRQASARKARERKAAKGARAVQVPCGGTLEYRTFAGMRVYGYEGDRRVYEHRCQRCGMTGTSDGSTTTCALLATVTP